LKIVVNFASAADFIADNSTPEGRLENQRVEVELVFVGN
jgi:outer membrane protein OmpA-like peptidoglycan-associated protein